VSGALGAACILAMMLLTVADVLLRDLTGRSIHGTFELVELLLAGAVFLALPAAFLREEHIVVDVVDHYAPRAVPALRRLSGVLALALLATLLWRSSLAAHDSWKLGDVTMDLAWPRLLYWIPLLAGVLCSLVAVGAMLWRDSRRR
jgi:TRAP-type C4-dicarboxylate transport system permease small subunit